MRCTTQFEDAVVRWAIQSGFLEWIEMCPEEACSIEEIANIMSDSLDQMCQSVRCKVIAISLVERSNRHDLTTKS